MSDFVEKTLWKVLENSQTETPVNRREILLSSRIILDVCMRKLLTVNLKDAKRLKFMRVAAKVNSVVGAVLKDIENEEILARLRTIEDRIR